MGDARRSRTLADSRRQFLSYCSTAGLTSTLFPGLLWARMQERPGSRVTLAMVREACQLAGLDFTEAEQQGMIDTLNRILARADDLHKAPPGNRVASPIHFDPRVPGFPVTIPALTSVTVPRPRGVTRPPNLEDAAFWPIAQLAELIRRRLVTSLELTEMYLARLERHNRQLNCVVTLTKERAREDAQRADAEIAKGRYRGLLHGIAWGAKDIIAARGYPTTWGASPFKAQVIDEDATVVSRLTEAGAVLVAKLTTGELAFGDQWFGGRTNNPWNPEEGSSGSSAGSGAATAAGLVGFSIGSDTGGSILSPSIRCGVVGLRPTFGRVSRHGVMAAGWTLDKLGPMCRTVEDCAIVLGAIAGPDGRDLAVPDRVPFGWDATARPRRLRVGHVPAMEEADTDPDARASSARAREAFERAGCEIRAIEVPQSDLTYFIEYTERAAGFEDFVRSRKDGALRRQRHASELRAYHLVPAVDYLQANRMRMRLMEQYALATRDVDVVLGGRVTLDGRTSLNALTSMTGHPAIAVATGFTPRGTPAGITLIGRVYDEATLLDAAVLLERATGLQGRRPPLD
jgi:Asp-tRNA(Asn)/Glu-tRNA(Gln) amidotransferase A subunit family amidase